MSSTANSNTLALQFNGLLSINNVENFFGTGTFPDRYWVLTDVGFFDNINDEDFPLDALPGDILIDVNRNRYRYEGETGTGSIIKSLPWEDQTSGYGFIQAGAYFIFRPSQYCNLYQHGRQSLLLSETIVEYMSQKLIIRLKNYYADQQEELLTVWL